VALLKSNNIVFGLVMVHLLELLYVSQFDVNIRLLKHSFEMYKYTHQIRAYFAIYWVRNKQHHISVIPQIIMTHIFNSKVLQRIKTVIQFLTLTSTLMYIKFKKQIISAIG